MSTEEKNDQQHNGGNEYEMVREIRGKVYRRVLMKQHKKGKKRQHP